jgi:hypothetical protein
VDTSLLLQESAIPTKTAPDGSFGRLHLTNPQKWNKYAYVINNPLMRIDPDGLDDYIVFRFAKEFPAGYDAARWAAVKGAIEGTVDSQGRPNHFIFYDDKAATLSRWVSALTNPDAHVGFIGHVGHEAGPDTPLGIGFPNGSAEGHDGAGGFTGGTDGSPIGYEDYPPFIISAKSVAIFGCNSLGISPEYSETTFTGINSPTGGIDLSTADAAAADFFGAGEGQVGLNGAQIDLSTSFLDSDAGSTISTIFPNGTTQSGADPFSIPDSLKPQ